MIRPARTDAELAAYVSVWNAVWPDEPVSLDFVLERVAREPERLYLLAEEDDRAVGAGFVGRSSMPNRCPVVIAVLPDWRRRGLGAALFDRCLTRARSLEALTVLGTVREDDAESLGFVERRGFTVTDRLVSLALDLGGRRVAPAPPDGIETAELTEDLHRQAYDVFCEGVADIPESSPHAVRPFGEWVDRLGASPLVLVALDAGRVVGFAELELRSAEAGVLDNNLTTVRRSHRGRGIAEALKRTQIAWAGERGYVRVITASHEANEPMRRLNEKLGYRPLPALLDVSRRLDE